ncbi:MAG: hypothetical protein HY270_08715 [Deltaproteobacteria bacterium]|nr:hypothetical protein [Deltaproteobacteria bacterium]
MPIDIAAAARRILSFSEYARIRHPTPYVIDVGGDDTRLVLFGGRHSSDPADPMFDQIVAAFARLSPAFAMHEGTPPAVEADREVAIRRHGEAGLVRHLAARVGVETASMDIPLEDEARLLLGHMSQGDALVYLVVRQLASFNRKTARMDFDGYFGDFFERIGPPLGIAKITWPHIATQHERLLGRALAPRNVTAIETDPMRNDLPTQRISRLSNRLRDEYMLRRLLDAVGERQRVFATVGVSHAVMLEAALVEAIGRSKEEME